LVIESLVENVYWKKMKMIYSLSLLQALPYEMVVQEKEGMIMPEFKIVDSKIFYFIFLFLFSSPLFSILGT